MTPIARALLTLSLIRGVGPARLRRAITAAIPVPADAVHFLEDAMFNDVLTPEQLRELPAVRATAEALVEQLHARGVEVISSVDAGYPVQLLRTWGDRVPPLLMTLGNVDLLNRPTVGFSGSRQASARGLRAARDCAGQLATAEVVVASGYAAGVDTCAHIAALEAGGATIVVHAEGIENFRMKPEIENVWSWERACVISEFAANASWSAGNALQRNRTIVGASGAMIVIEARSTGGTIATGRDALKGKVPLFAVEYDGMPESAIGNRQLIARGARPLLRNRRTSRANLEGVLDAVKKAALAAETTLATRQMFLLT